MSKNSDKNSPKNKNAKKRGIKDELKQTLVEACKRFYESPRFEMMRHLEVAQVLGADAEKKCPKLSFESLCEEGPEKLFVAGVFDEEAVKELIDRLNTFSALPSMPTLVDTPPIKVSEEPLERSPSSGPRSEEPTSPGPKAISTVRGSIEAELRLNNSILDLKQAPHFEENKSRTLGEFWDPTAPRAPFEECLTLVQVSQLKSENLLKKRSIGPKKIMAVISAIDNFIKSAPKIEAAHEVIEFSPQKRKRSSHPAVSPWNISSADLPLFAQSLLAYSTQQHKNLEGSEPLARFLAQLARVISGQEFILLWLGRETSINQIAKILKIEEKKAGILYESARSRLREAFERDCEETARTWGLALGGPGVRIDDLLLPIKIQGLEPAYLRAMCLLLLDSLSAQNPAAWGSVFRKHLTLNEHGIQIILDGVLAGLPKKDSDLRREIGILLPFFAWEEVLPAFERRATFKAKEAEWYPRLSLVPVK